MSQKYKQKVEFSCVFCAEAAAACAFHNYSQLKPLAKFFLCVAPQNWSPNAHARFVEHKFYSGPLCFFIAVFRRRQQKIEYK